MAAHEVPRRKLTRAQVRAAARTAGRFWRQVVGDLLDELEAVERERDELADRAWLEERERDRAMTPEELRAHYAADANARTLGGPSRPKDGG
jgi:hypothetical protein